MKVKLVGDARQLLRDAAMRRGLLAYLWGCQMEAEASRGEVPRPMPIYDDLEIQKELKRILLGK